MVRCNKKISLVILFSCLEFLGKKSPQFTEGLK